MNKIEFTEEQIQKMHEMAASGMIDKEIEKKLNINHNVFTRIKNKYNIVTNKYIREKFADQETKQKVIEMLNNDFKIKDIISELNISKKVLRKIRDELGFVPKGKYIELNKNNIIEYYKQNNNITETAIKFNISRKIIADIINKENLLINRSVPYEEITDNIKNLIVEDYEINLIILSDLAQKYNKGQATIEKILLEKNIILKDFTYIGEELIEQIEDMILEEFSLDSISEKLNINKGIVKAHIERCNKNKRNKKFANIIIEKFITGNYTIRELGDELEITHNYVSKIINKYNVFEDEKYINNRVLYYYNKNNNSREITKLTSIKLEKVFNVFNNNNIYEDQEKFVNHFVQCFDCEKYVQKKFCNPKKSRNICLDCTDKIEKDKQDRLLKSAENKAKRKIAKSIRSRINEALKGTNKYYTHEELDIIFNALGYSREDLKNHIEHQFTLPGNEWMHWGNWGAYRKDTWKDDDLSTHKWQLDHREPFSDFEYQSLDDEEFKKCWSLSNLRPYSAKQNVLDGVYRTRHKNKPSAS